MVSDQTFLQNKLNLAIKLFNTNKLDEAIECFKYLEENQSTNQIALLYLGIIEIRKNNTKSAKEYFYKIPASKLNEIFPCFPTLGRRFVKTNDICNYVYTHFVSNLKENSRVIFPTGNTPLKLYKYCRENGTKTFQIYQMDEYYKSDEYRKYLKTELSNKHHFHFIDSFAQDIDAECERHEKDCNNVDLCVLGIGQNGHIGFNEPLSPIDSCTRKIDLSKNTQNVNNTSSTMAITIGLKTILSSKKIVLIANKNKKNIIEKLIKCTKFNSELPASCLGLHKNVHIIYQESNFGS